MADFNVAMEADGTNADTDEKNASEVVPTRNMALLLERIIFVKLYFLNEEL